jgi:hypothetical protein
MTENNCATKEFKKLEAFFQGEGMVIALNGIEGGLSPAETAIRVMEKFLNIPFSSSGQVRVKPISEPHMTPQHRDARRWRMAKILGIAVIDGKGKVTGAHFNEGAEQRVDAAIEKFGI